MTRHAVALNASGLLLASALAMVAWVAIGAAFAPTGEAGSFDPWAWPAVVLAALALALLLVAKRLAPKTIDSTRTDKEKT